MFKPYLPRPLVFLGVESIRGHRLKVYSIHEADVAFERARFDDGCAQLDALLPTADASSGCPGLGFVILHQGVTGDYLILCWWDRENELPTRVLIRDSGVWRAAQGGESFCVWDLRVMWFEREAYVATMLAHRSAEDYLAQSVAGFA